MNVLDCARALLYINYGREAIDRVTPVGVMVLPMPLGIGIGAVVTVVWEVQLMTGQRTCYHTATGQSQCWTVDNDQVGIAAL